MAEVVIYTKPGCSYCFRAKALLDGKGVDYEEVVAAFDPEKKAEMVKRAKGASTYPQVFIDGKHVGGSDDLYALDARGALDALLAA